MDGAGGAGEGLALQERREKQKQEKMLKMFEEEVIIKSNTEKRPCSNS